MFILVFVSMSAYAQSLTVTGKVIDSEGYEVIGGSVTIKGAAGVGTVTDVNGNYSLKVNDASKDVLVFSYVGMTSQEVKVDGRSVIDVTLKADAVMLEEVVAIGYATVKRKDLTGSVASVNSKELSKVPTSDITQALAGRMAGVQVMQSEGAPGALFQFVFVEVFPLLKAMNLFISLMVFRVKTECPPLIRQKLKLSTF
mgnify:CR=1 FL=1